MIARRSKDQRHRACLLLGSNIQPEENLRRAVELLRQYFVVEKVSAAWETPAVGSDGPDFLNAAVVIHTSLDPWQLKERFLRPLEAQLGRVRTADKNAPRTIDIDIVSGMLTCWTWMYGNMLMPPCRWLSFCPANNPKKLANI